MNAQTRRLLAVAILVNCLVAQSEVRITNVTVAHDGRVTLEVASDLSSYYVLRAGASVREFNRSVDIKLGTDRTVLLHSDGDSAPQQFFVVNAIQVNNPSDLDSDGFDDVFEIQNSPQFNPLVPNEPMGTGVRGRIVDASGGVASAAVVLYDTGVPGVHSDEHGNFQILGIPTNIGPLHLHVRKLAPSGLRTAEKDFAPVLGGVVDLGDLQINELPKVSAQRLAAGQYSTIALRNDGTVWGWGANHFGGLGHAHGAFPGSVAEGIRWQLVSTTGNTTFGIDLDGRLWGLGYGRELGAGWEITETAEPMAVGSESRWRSVSAGRATLAVREDGSLWGWGDNSFGQLGVEVWGAALLPVPIETNSTWIAVAAGWDYTLAVRSDGSLWATGDNQFGQLGDGTTTQRTKLTRIGNQNTWRTVGASPFGQRSYGIQADGSLWHWGAYVDPVEPRVMEPQQVGVSLAWQQIAVGAVHTVALQRDGSLWVWGSNYAGLLGNGTGQRSFVPLAFRAGEKWSAIAAGGEHCVALRSDGTLWAWGANGSGQLGNGVATQSNPLIQFGTNSNWKLAAAGSGFSLAIDAEGQLWAWGNNELGQLGTGSSENRHLPIRVQPSTRWKFASAGRNHSLAIRDDGTLWAWGGNTAGVLGDGTTVSRIVPTVVGRSADWRNVSAGGSHSLGTKTDGSLWAWGGNSRGQLGLGNTTIQLTPARFSLGNDWLAAAAGSQHSLAITGGGVLYAWGDNSAGQVGDGTSNNLRSRPVRVGNNAGWKSVAAGQRHSLAAHSDGSIWTWGFSGISDEAGSMPLDRSRPFKVDTRSPVTAVAAGYTSSSEQSYFITETGDLFGWGGLSEAFGGNTSAPSRINSVSDWISISSGETHLLAIRADGTLWISGSSVIGLQGVEISEIGGGAIWGFPSP